MIEDFIDAFRNFARSKTRTFLSLLGVIIGVASVIVITSMGASSTKQIEDTFGSSGLDIVSVSAGGFMRRNRDSVELKFDESFRSELFGQIQNIKKSGTKIRHLLPFLTEKPALLQRHMQLNPAILKCTD